MRVGFRRMLTHMRRNQFSPHDDRGVSLPELLVAMLIATAIIGALVSLVAGTSRLTLGAQSSTQTMGQLESASTQLLRDVTDARQVIEATPSSLTLEVVRDSACVLTTWTAAEGALSVSRTTFTQDPSATGDPSCASTGGEVAQLDVVERLAPGAEPFAYYSRASTSTPLDAPVSADDVARVTWELTATPAYPDDAEARTVTSGAAIDQRTGTSGGGQVQDARAPLLEVVTPHEGVGQPVLEWTDPTPTVTASWTVFRIAYPEGGTAAGTWEALIAGLPGAQSTYTDGSLPAGYTARYIVRATLTDGRTGPTSSQVATGIRPAPVTLTATGQSAAIALSWTAAPGATAYDVYRDGTLYQASLPGTSWSDATGRGHSHAYRVVPVNRWERCATRAAQCTEALQNYQVPVGTADTATLPAGTPSVVRRLSAATAAAGAFTTALTPTLTVTPNADWSNTLTYAPAAWTGTGPVTKGGVHRDRGWGARVGDGTGTSSGAWPTGNNVWPAETPLGTNVRAHVLTQAQVAGQYRHYQVRTCNAVGCSPWTATVTGLQRPPTPSCTATRTGITTREIAVVTSRPTIPSPYTSNRINGWYEGAATGYTASTLAHDSTHMFGTHTRNDSPANSGWSDEAQCSAKTDRLDPPTIVVTGITTRSAAAGATAVTAGSRLSAGPSIAGGSSSRSDLSDGAPYGVTASVTDGHNVVSGSVGFSTRALPTAGCTMSGGGDAPATITATALLAHAEAGVWSQARLGAGPWTTDTASTTTLGTWAGYARATDGLNTGAVMGCGSRSITQPWITAGATPGAPSAVCAPYRAYGDVINLLTASTNAGQGYLGLYIGAPTSQWAADSGSYVSGDAASRTLRCAFYREHMLMSAVGSGQQVGTWTASALWSMSGPGAF